MEQRVLTKDDILQTQDCQTLEVKVPEWGGSVRVKALSVKERETYQELVTSKKKSDGSFDTKGLTVRFLQLCLVDEQGRPLFAEADLGKLEEKSAAVMDRLLDAARKHNRIGEDLVTESEKN